jgi:hypothetical protein
VTILGTGKTDDSGTATVQIEYPQNVATWARVKILVSATGVSGTEGRATWTEVLPAPAAAFTASSFPAFGISPYGEIYLSVDPTQPPYSKTTFPDGTPIPGGVIADPCRNPF